MLILSHVLPFPGSAGQQMRVLNKLLAFRELFDVTFLTYTPRSRIEETRNALLEIVPGAIVLPSRVQQNVFTRLIHKTAGVLYRCWTWLKESNYIIGKVELTPRRIDAAIAGMKFDIALFEYWHAYKGVQALRKRGIPCVVDIHDILWQSYKRMIEAASLPRILKQASVARYRSLEKRAWRTFDAVIAINKAEQEYLQTMNASKTVFYAPMGIDLAKWDYDWEPNASPRLAYYGGLGNVYNQQDALLCYSGIMPGIWERFPEAEFWMVGGNPPKHLLALADSRRVFVPGYVDRVQDVLKTMSVVLCPFNGTFGFRSRLIEVMAVGVPVVASKDAAYGMDLPDGDGIFLCDSVPEILSRTIQLLDDGKALAEQSRRARKTVEEMYGFDQCYGRLARELLAYTLKQRNVA